LVSTTPLVSVICLCYNHKDYIKKTLNTVINQTYNNIELIIIDDCSPDESDKEIKDWINNNKYKKVIFNSKNIGVTKSFNKAYAYAKGEYIIDLAADDELLPDSIENHLKNFEKNSFKPGVSYGNCEFIDEKDNHMNYHYAINEKGRCIDKQSSGNVYAKVLKSYFIASPTMMSHMDVFKKLNGYDEELYFEDFDFEVRASRYFPFYFCDQIVVRKRELPNSMSKSLTKRFDYGSYYHRRSFYKILNKATKLNKTKQEDDALLSRLYSEIIICIKALYWNYAFLNALLSLKVIKTKLFHR